MPVEVAPKLPWTRLSELIAGKMGLHFPPERHHDLQRGLAAAAGDFGFEDSAACADWLLTTPLDRSQLQTLAARLTIGETYFFRDKKIFDALAQQILPPLIQQRACERRLRFWSAACCTGEEAYSLAMLLHRCIPDIDDWRITILATDINEQFLHKAAAGVYSNWSFRDSSADFKDRYFTRTADGRFAIHPTFKQYVQFAPLNLVDDNYPALATDTHAMDVIFCRNVLMYFTPQRAREVVSKLRLALLDRSWLAVSPAEMSQTLFSGFKPRNFPGAILYQKLDRQQEAPQQATSFSAGHAPALNEVQVKAAAIAAAPPEAAEEPARQDVATPYSRAAQLYRERRYAEAADTLLCMPELETADAQTLALLTRACANQGRLDAALSWSGRWIAADPLDAGARYLSAVIQQELGNFEHARRALQQALYLKPDFVLAHFALGNLARGNGKFEEANKHFANALVLLHRHDFSEPLPEADGLTAGRLRDIITSLLRFEIAS